MARIIDRGHEKQTTARYRHNACGSYVEYFKSDVKNDQREGSWVVCPVCPGNELIDAKALQFKSRCIETCSACKRASPTDYCSK